MSEHRQFAVDRDGVLVTELAPVSLHVVRIRKPSERIFAELHRLSGISWPTTPNSSVGINPTISWLGPEEWLVEAASPALLSELEFVCAGHAHHIAGVSDGRVRFEISGSRCRLILARDCSLDFHPRSFSEGQCAQTLFAQIPVFICRAGIDRFQLLADISFTNHLRTWFRGACGSVPD